MANEYTAERLMRWGSDCNREGNGALGLALVRYAEAWEKERGALWAENERLRADPPDVENAARILDDHDMYEEAEKLLRRASFPRAHAHECDHEWVSARNEAVAAGEVCPKCGALRAEPEWLTHDSHQPPADLAPAQLVELQAPTSGGVFAVRRVDDLPWHPGLRYRPALSASGLLLVSAEGLEPWATHVRVDESGEVWQFDRNPTDADVTFAKGAPETHRRPGPASESLMEVWCES